MHPPRAVQLLADADQVGQAGLQVAGQVGGGRALAGLCVDVRKSGEPEPGRGG